jgi:hypothetical protein
MKKLLSLTIAAVLIVLGFSGCPTLPDEKMPPGDVGFPLIDIVDAVVEVKDDSQFAGIEEKKWERSSATKVIGGTVGSKIVPKDITIRLEMTSFQVPIKNGADVTGWFLNIPKGLTATAHADDPKAKFAADKGAEAITVTIEGTPKEPINQRIKIRIPYEVTNRAWDFDIPPNEDRRFEVYGVDVAAIVVGGAIGREIDPKPFTIKIAGTKVREELIPILKKGTDITNIKELPNIFPNIPGGLHAYLEEDVVMAPEKEQQSVTIVIKGTPTVQVKTAMEIKIPAEFTTANMELVVPTTGKAMYDIGSYATAGTADLELRTGTNWKGVVEGWGLTGPEVYKLKDFTAVKIIQLEKTSYYEIGEDGEYHWTGDSITYGDLMNEAKQYDAHAIIDVVIDSKDTISVKQEQRHVEDGHKRVPGSLEDIKYNNGIITETDDPNGGLLYLETIIKTVRQWTGTALAIRYAPAYEPTGDGGRYVPSVPSVSGFPTAPDAAQ